MNKVAYVKSQGQTRSHECHWPGCTAQVPPALWGCKTHWYKLPADIRQAIWNTFRPGQEKTLTPSREYVKAANAAQQWIRDYLAGELEKPRVYDNRTLDLFNNPEEKS